MINNNTLGIGSLRILAMAVVAGQALIACGEMDAGYEQLYLQDEASVTASTDSSSQAELRGEPQLGTCEDQGFDSYQLSEEVSILWNEYVQEMQDRRLGTNLVRLVSGFEQIYCSEEVPAKVWANGRPSCSMVSVPVSDGRNFSLRADSQDNPAVIQVQGCVLERTVPESFNR